MKTTITELVQKFVSDTENWYVDTHNSVTYVGIENKQNFGGFIGALEKRNVEYFVTIEKENNHEVRVWY